MSHPTTTGVGAVVAPVREADAVAAAVLACPGVVRLHTGGLRQVATYLPGRRVDGVRIDGTTVEVAVVAAFGVPVPALATRIRAAVELLLAGRVLDVHVADVALPSEPLAKNLLLPTPSGLG